MLNRRNERGAALLLALLLVFLVSVLAVPLLAGTRSGYAHSIRAQHAEQAASLAESSLRVSVHAVIEAIETGHVNLSPDQVVQFIQQYAYSLDPLYSDKAQTQVEARVEKAKGSVATLVVTSTGKVGTGKYQAVKTASLHLYVNTAGAENGSPILPIFESGITTGGNWSRQAIDRLEQYVEAAGGGEPAIVSNHDFSSQFLSFYEGKINGAPSPHAPPFPSGTPPRQYPLVKGDVIVDSSRPGVMTDGDIRITNPAGNRILVIDGSLIASGTITIDGWYEEIIIQGDLAANRIVFNPANKIGKWTIKGHVHTETSLVVEAQEVRIAGNLTGNADLDLSSAQWIQIGGALAAGGHLEFGYLRRLEVQGTVSCLGNAAFNGSMDEGFVGQSIQAGGDLTFQSVDSLAVAESVSAGRNLMFQNAINEVTIGGSLVAGQDMEFDYIQGLKLNNGHLAGQNIRFHGAVHQLDVAGSLYANDAVEFEYINAVQVKDSLLAGRIRFNGTVGHLGVGGLLMARESLTLPYINKLIVGSFLGTNGGLTFGNGTAGSQAFPAVILGGLAVGQEVNFQGWYADNSIIIDYHPPEGFSDPQPSVSVGQWTFQ